MDDIMDNIYLERKRRETESSKSINEFQMPLHYPNYTEKDYQDMSEQMIDKLLEIYGLPTNGDLAYKRDFAMGAFLWPYKIPKLHDDTNMDNTYLERRRREMESSKSTTVFQMPLHYPRYTEKDYQDMPEYMIDRLLKIYGLPTDGDLAYKRNFAMGAFLWKS